MQGLDKALNNSINGPETNLLLETFHRQVETWGFPLPPVEPLVLDFGLGQFDKTGLIEYWIANEMTAGYCGKYLFVFGGQQCPAHSHRIKHETFFLLRGCLSVQIDGRTIELQPGQILAVPPGKVHSFRGLSNSLLLELSMACDVCDNSFEDPRIMNWLKHVA